MVVGKARRLCLFFGRCFGRLMYVGLGDARRRALANLVRAFPAMNSSQRQALLLRSFQHQGMGIAETLWAWCGLDRHFDGHCLEGGEHVDAALAGGRGALLVQPQVSCIDGAAVPVDSRWPLHVVSGFTDGSALATWVRRRREGVLSGVYDNVTMRPLLRGLRRGEFIWMCPDVRVPASQGGVRTRFLGRDAMMSSAPARLAAMADVPVIPVFPIREDGGSRYRVVFGPALDLNADPAVATQQLAQEFERHVKQHPEQYVWSARRFESRRSLQCSSQAPELSGDRPARHH